MLTQYRAIRNTNKKLQSIQKTEGTIGENSGVSLDDLVKQKKINQDQKAQILKKPQIEAQLKQLEEQKRNFEEFAKELEAKHDKEKASLQETHQAELQKAKDETQTARDEATQHQSNESTTKVKDAIRTTCQFLYAVAVARGEEKKVEGPESQAYEAVLNDLYQGTQKSIDVLTNLVEGSEEKVSDSNDGPTIEFTFAQLKASAEKTPSALSTNVEDEESTPQENVDTPAVDQPEVDQTVANAGLTELEDTTTLPTTENAAQPEADAAPEQVSTTGEAANAVAEASWAPEQPLSASQTGEDWVQVPRDPAETETPHAPAPNTSGSNWADEVTVAAEESGPPPVLTENDGFSEVRRDRGGSRGGRGQGRGRGRGGRGEFRGQRGRGRGGQSRG